MRIARELRAWFPQLKKYRKRKTLSAAEKAAISRYQKTKADPVLRHAVPLTAAQARSLGKKALAGGGMRAVLLEGHGKDSYLTIRNGVPVIRSGQRTTNILETAIDYDAMMLEARAIVDANPGKQVRFWLWTVRGRGRQSMSLKQLQKRLALVFFTRYSPTGEPEEYLKGLQYQLYTVSADKQRPVVDPTGTTEVEIVTVKRRKRKRRGKKK